MTISIAKINGLELLQEALNPKRIKKDISIGVGRAALAIHSELRFAVARQYRAPGDLNSVLIGKTASARDFGRNIIKAELTYTQPSINLARYMNGVQPTLGNIPPLPKMKQGWVHTVEIVRGRRKVVFGKKNLGGFTPRDSKGTLVRKNGRAIMMERGTDKKYPVHQLFGPTLASLAMKMYDTDPQVQKAKERATDIILETIDFL
jgi:hypothetical protein